MNSEFKIDNENIIIFERNNLPDRLISKQEEDKSNFYQEFYDSRASNALMDLRTTQAEKIIVEFSEYFHQPQRPPDIGCGSGIFLEIVKNSYKNLTVKGLEPAIKNKKDIESLTLSEYVNSEDHQKYSVVALLDVFEHQDNPKLTIHQVKKVLEREGIILIKVPNKDAIMYKIAKWFRFIIPSISKEALKRLYQADYPPPHFFYWNLASINQFMQENDCKIVKYIYLSDIKIATLHKRLWGISKLKKILIYIGTISLKLVSLSSWSDSILIAVESNEI